jgi:rhodanese-related sulfurtransferase
MLNYKTLIIAAFVVMGITIIIGGCAPAVINQKIDTKTAYEMIQGNQDNPNFVLVDVRTPVEFKAGHLAKAVMVDFEASDFKARISELERSKKYLLYCRTANRSGQAAKIMKDLGFREVYDMAGGINQWKSAGYPVVTD